MVIQALCSHLLLTRWQAGIDDTARAAGLTAGHIESVVEDAKNKVREANNNADGCVCKELMWFGAWCFGLPL